MACVDGITLPACGLHFGSEYLGGPGSDLLDFLPTRGRRQIQNADQVATVHMFDLWANHHDERQRVYRRAVRPGPYTAFFIDNGHLFGGPSWLEGTRRAHRLSFLYPEECLPGEQDAERAVEKFEACIPPLLQHAIGRIPRQWYKGDIVGLSGRLLKRLACLRSIVDLERERLRRTAPSCPKDSYYEDR